LWMRSSRVIRASGSPCQSRNSPGFDPSIRQSGEAAGEAVLNSVLYCTLKEKRRFGEKYKLVLNDPSGQGREPSKRKE